MDTPTPQDALYWENSAALKFQREGALNEAQRGREGAQASYRYGSGQVRKQLPLRLTANQQTANNQGLLESGVLAQRQGRAQTEAAGQLGRLGEQRKAAIERYNQNEAQAKRAYELGEGKNIIEATERGKRALLENPPKPTANANGFVQAPGGSYRTGPGSGWVKTPRGSYRTAASRRIAIERAKGVG